VIGFVIGLLLIGIIAGFIHRALTHRRGGRYVR